MTPPEKPRLAYIDWLRGLACVLMFQTHCYDAWLGGTARNSKFYSWSQIGGTFPAPLFLFLAGISFAIVVNKLLQKDASPGDVARATITRGAEILALGLLFRLQEFAISLGWAPWTDLFRVDILNTIGVSMMLLGVMCWAVLATIDARRGATGVPARPDSGLSLPHQTASAGVDTRRSTNLLSAALLVSAAISLLTPLLWTIWRPRFLPWEIETYIDGVHNLGKPQTWLFPIFPWTGFAFAGLALGFLLTSESTKKLGGYTFLLIGGAGISLVCLSQFLASRKLQIYPVYDYWHTSPNFFMVRVGMLMLLLWFAYLWCRWGLGRWGFSPLIQLGQTSLLVYWVHIEFVYGRFTILPHHGNSIATASAGLCTIFLAMLALSLLRTKSRGRFAAVLSWSHRSQPTAPSNLA